MNTAYEVKKTIEALEIQHPRFADLYEALNDRIQDALQGDAARIEWVVGPSRVGKSMLINTLSRSYPETRVSGKRHVPVLTVPISPNISPKLLPASVLLGLGLPVPPRSITSGVLGDRIRDQLRLAHTRVVIFEEASHLVEPGARVAPRAAGDWFKTLADDLNMTLILFGVPRLEKLFASNEQLRFRASSRKEFRPYDMRNRNDQQAFASCVSAYADLFKQSGWPVDLAFKDLVLHCYLLSGGTIGVLSRFMQELASQLRRKRERAITLEDCRSAVRNIEGVNHPRFSAFYEEEVSAVALHAVHAHVLEMNGMALPEYEKTGRAT